MSKQDQRAITWFQFNNIVPILVAVITLASTFWALNTKVELLNQKMDIVIANQEKYLTQLDSMEGRFGTLALKVNTLETKIK